MDPTRAADVLATSSRALRARLQGLEAASRDRLGALLELGRAERALDDPSAEETLLAAHQLAESLAEAAAQRAVLVELGAWLAGHGEPALGRAYLERALEGATAAADAGACVAAASELALVRALGGDAEGAAATLERGRAALAGAPGVTARFELRRAEVAAARSDVAASRAAYQRARLALEGCDALERAVVSVALGQALERSPPAPPAASELGALPAGDLAALLAGVLELVATPAPTRATRAVELARQLTGASGAHLLAGERILATSGLASAATSLVRAGDIALGFVAPARGDAPRREIVARALLAVLAAPVESGTTSRRLLAMLDRVLDAGMELSQLAVVATDLAVEATGAARGVLLLRESGTELVPHAARAGGRDLADAPRVASRSLLREAFLSGRAILLEDAAADPELSSKTSIGGRGLRSVLVAPIKGADGAVLGVMYLDDPGTAARFGAAEREVAVSFAERLGRPLAAVLARERERARIRSALAGTKRARPALRHSFDEILGTSDAVVEMLTRLDRTIEAASPVLVTGESGSGKELVARAIHRHGPRASGPFVAVSCSSLAEPLLESELFGHVPGAFTGATGERRGLFESAHGGVLFLDEVQDASPRLQAQLLRVLETGEVRRIGAEEAHRVDVRVIAATNADLGALVARGSFREDLLYRLHVLPVRVPPLRDRVEDVPVLVAHLLARAGAPGRPIEPAAMERILADPWPGNVRALRNCIERALALAGPGPLRSEHVQLEMPRRAAQPPERPSVYVGAVALNERQLALLDRLRAEGDVNSTDYAERAGVTPQTAWRDLADLVAKGILVRSGRGKKTLYRLAAGWGSRGIVS